jgi:hypothetical protein
MSTKSPRKVEKKNYPIYRVMGGKSEKQIAEENEYFKKQAEASRLKAIRENADRQQTLASEHEEPLLYGSAVAHRNFEHDRLLSYHAKSHEELQKIYAKYINLCQRRGMPLSSEDQDFGRLYLEQLLSQPQRPQPVEAKNLAQRLKEVVSKSPF